jgi:hypothetical protein
MLATLGLNSIISVNTTVPSVTVQGGITYTDLCPFLGKKKIEKIIERKIANGNASAFVPLGFFVVFKSLPAPAPLFLAFYLFDKISVNI